MKIKDLKKYNDEQPDGYGLEIEVEGANLPRLDNGWWQTHEDGSLRGESCEYVTNGAVVFEDLPKALKSLNNSLRRKESELHLSFRTSVHVHMNVREMEINKLGSVLYLYYLFEEMLMKYCGRERVGNRFCLRLRDSEEIVNNLVNAFRYDFSRGSLDPNALKYAALNIAPIQRFGTIEFRSMRGTVDSETLLTWVGLINCLKNSRFSSASEVSEFADVNGYEVLAIAVFGDMLQVVEYEGWKQDVVRNASLAIELPYMLKEKERSKPKKINIDEAVKKMEMFFADPPPGPIRRVDADIDVILDEIEQEEF